MAALALIALRVTPYVQGRLQSSPFERARADFDRAVLSEPEQPFHRSYPFAGINQIHSLRADWAILTIYEIGDAYRAPRWLVRQASGGPGQRGRVRWADSLHCPAVRQVAEGFQTLETPKILPLDQVGGGMSDGVRYEVWSNQAAFASGAAADLRFSGNVNTPLAAFSNNVAARLEPCWRDQKPN